MKLAFIGDIQWNAEFPTIDRNILSKLKECDYVFADLEGPIEGGGTPITKSGPSLYSSLQIVEFLTQLSVTHACCANNHIMDLGPNGLSNTVQILGNSGIECLGIFNPHKIAPYVILEKNGRKVVVLNVCEDEFSTILKDSRAYSISELGLLLEEINQLDDIDKTVLVIHSGIENIPLPPEYLVNLNRFLIEKNVDVIVGHHNHIYSISEHLNSSFIHYGLGNFLIPMPDNYKMSSLYWKQGAILIVDFEELMTIDEIFIEHRDSYLAQISKEEMKAVDVHVPIKDLNAYWKNYFDRDYKTFLYEFEPYTFDILRGFYIRGFLPSLISKKRKTLLLNILRSQSNRFLRINALGKCVGY